MLRWMSIFFACIAVEVLAAVPSLDVGGSYAVDISPFESHPKLASEYQKLHEKFSKQPLSLAEHRRRMDIISELLTENPKWIDGYWLLATDTFFMSAELAFFKKFEEAKNLLNEGLQATGTCLEIDKKQFLCSFFEAALIAKKASIDGIFSSLSQGKKVHDLWEDVIKAKKNIVFQSNVSLLGSAHYGLGLFYRLVPDFFLIDWFWGIRGNLDKSIEHHRLALRYDPENPCANLMLAVSLLCKANGDLASVEFQEAQHLLKKAEDSPAIDLAQQVCTQDVPNIRKHPDRTCGYTQAKYHEKKSEDELRRSEGSTIHNP